jgi:hypothetical protein
MGTINSGGKFTVSPASSIHEDDEEAYGYGPPAGLSPSPPGHYRDAAQGPAGWSGGDVEGQTRLWHGQVQTQVQQPSGADIGGTLAPVPVAPALWQTQPDESEIPYPATEHWRGSRDLLELSEARARARGSGQTPATTSYGPGLPRGTAALPIAAAYLTTTSNTTPAPTSTPWQTQQHHQQQHHQQPH